MPHVRQRSARAYTSLLPWIMLENTVTLQNVYDCMFSFANCEVLHVDWAIYNLA